MVSSRSPEQAPGPAGLLRVLPGLQVLRGYKLGWLRNDLVAGIVLTALLVPQGMAYAELAGLPPVTGLYATVVGLVAYAVFGPSRILVLGPDSSLAPLIFAAIVPLVAAGAPAGDRVALAMILALLMGVICIVAGIARLGVVAELLSQPIRVGYINGIALVVLLSQLPKLFGFSGRGETIIDQVRVFARGLGDGRTNVTALLIGLGCLAVILLLKRFAPKVPGVLVAVVGATVLVLVADLERRGVSVVGDVPGGFPRPALPEADWGQVRTLVAAAFGVAFITLADTVALSRTFSKRDDPVDTNQEVIALGAANVATGLFQGFPISASSSRTAVAVSTGARSQLTGLVGAVGVVALLVGANNATRHLPAAALAAVVVAASLSLFDLGAMRDLWDQRRSEFLLALAAFLGVVLIGVLEGIAIAIGLSLANVIRRAWRPYNAALGRIDGRKGYHDIKRHPDARLIPGLLIFRFDAPLFFANAEEFGRRVRDLIRDREADEPVKRVIVAAEPVSDIDTTAAEVLTVLLDELDERGIELVFAELKDGPKGLLDQYGLFERLARYDDFPPTLGTAIDDYVVDSGVDWVDWEERGVEPERTPGPDGPDVR